MKKNLIMMLAVGLGFTVSVNAQQTDKIKFGVNAGANLTTLGTIAVNDGTTTKDYKFNHKPGITAGVFAEIPLGGSLKFVPEVNYSEKGADVEGKFLGMNTKLEQKLTYIDVPVAFAYEATPGLNIFAGPQVAFLMSQQSKTYVDGNETGSETSKKDYNKAIAGGLIGLGYDFTPNVHIKARYMRDFQKGSSNDDPNLDKVKNSGYALTLGYKF